MGGHGVVGTYGCRRDVHCGERFDDKKRVASNCDRVLYTPGQGWTIERYFVAVPDDQADWASGVFQSDHDPVVAIAKNDSSDACMLIVTFNCEAQSRPAIGGTWSTFLDLVQRKAGRRLQDFAAVCLCLQEAGKQNTMAADLRAFLNGSHTVVENKTDPRLATNFVVHCIVALAKDTYGTSPGTESREMFFGGRLAKLVARDKGAAFVEVSGGRGPGFTVGSAHLPIDKHDKPPQGSLGFGLRKAALQYISQQYGEGFVVVAGDLNFRRHVPVPGAQNGDELRASGVLGALGLEELHELGSNTCKLATVPVAAMGADPNDFRDNEVYDLSVVAPSEYDSESDDSDGVMDIFPSASAGLDYAERPEVSELAVIDSMHVGTVTMVSTVDGTARVAAFKSAAQAGGRSSFALGWAALAAVTVVASMIQ